MDHSSFLRQSPDGVMKKLILAKDWTSSSLGPIESWSKSLCMSLSIALASKFPIIVFWGEDLNVLYNDAFIPLFGPMKHPNFLGASGKIAWYDAN